MAADLTDESLRSALEFAVAIAAVGVKLRPPMPVPSGFKPYLRFQKLPSAALTTLRAAVEGDAMFLHRLSVVATPELVDDVGMLWLTRPDGWHAAAVAAAKNRVAAADEAGELRREQKRRKAAEAVAARSRVESAALADQLEAERAGRATVVADARQLKSELGAARAHIRQLERSIEKLTKALNAAAMAAHEPASKARKSATAEPTPSARTRHHRKPIAVPGGLPGNSEAVGEHMLRFPGVTVLVDGYNVAKLGWKTLSLEQQRTKCIDAAENIARRWGTAIHVVFDGTSVVGAVSAKRRLIRVSYSPEGVIADDVLRAEVAAIDLARPVVVVTNDQAVVKDVRAAGANVVSSDTFLALARR
ncbi:MAG: NYN domain-containing protein [Actinomycetia bacterium]|nr:NYN domain-containing protein [Actinomycetes bacterium]